MNYTFHPGHEVPGAYPYHQSTPFPPELVGSAPALYPSNLGPVSYPAPASVSVLHSAQPVDPSVQYVADRPAPYPAIQTVRAFGPRRSVEAERGQFMRAGVIRVCECLTLHTVDSYCYVKGVSDVSVTVQRGIRRRAMPTSSATQVNQSSSSSVSQAVTPQPAPLRAPQIALSSDHKQSILTEAKRCLRNTILCDIPFPSKEDMKVQATRALDSAINMVLEGAISNLFYFFFLVYQYEQIANNGTLIVSSTTSLCHSS